MGWAQKTQDPHRLHSVPNESRLGVRVSGDLSHPGETFAADVGFFDHQGSFALAYPP